MTLTKVWSKYNNPFNFINKGNVDVGKIADYLLSKNEDKYFDERLNLTHHQHGKILIVQDYPGIGSIRHLSRQNLNVKIKNFGH